MDFSKIEGYLSEINKWHHINKTNQYLYKDDILLGFNFNEFENFQISDLPEVIRRFKNIMQDRVFNIESISTCNVEFKYDNTILQNITLYKFSGHRIGSAEYKESLYYSTLSEDINKQITKDSFAFLLVHLFNNPRTLKYITDEYGLHIE